MTSDPRSTDFGRISVEERILPGRTRASAIVRLGPADSRRPVLWGSGPLGDLTAALEHVAGQDVEAVVLVGSAHSFGSGADLDEVAGISTLEQGETAGLIGWRAFRLLEDIEVPSFALITGYALGGALELALFADHRIARADTKGIALPEVGLGIIPGWGGAYRIARLIGPEAAIATAVDDSLRGRLLRAEQAAERGLVDEVLPAEDWDSAWQEWVAARIDAGKRRLPAEPPVSAEEWQQFVGTARERLKAGRPRVSTAAEATLDLIAAARSQDRDAAQEATVRAFAAHVQTEAARASIYVQGLLRRQTVLPAHLEGGTPRPIAKAAVIGAGLMASQLAALIARSAGVPVTLTDLDQERADRGVELVKGHLARQVRRGKLDTQTAERIGAQVSGTTDLAQIADADLVIEAVFEDLEVKRQAFAQVERHIAPEAILATNTSSLSIGQIAEPLAHPERVVGFHVFNPVDAVPLVEIIPGEKTSPDALATALALSQTLRRRPVVSADRPAFIVNRVLTRLFDVITRALDAGQDPRTVDRALDPIGLPMTPLTLLDFVGNAVQHHVGETLHEAFPERFARSPWLDRVVERGLARVLDDSGELTPEARALLPEPSAAQRDPDDILEDALLALAEEIGLMLDEGVVPEPEDVDLSLILGANYPRYIGGITPLLDSTGTAEKARGTRFHPRGKASLP